MTKPDTLLANIHQCHHCEPHLALGAKPIIQFHPNAKILIAGQAPGKQAHMSGIPFDDASGDRLRQWMGIDKDSFYDPKTVAILPMGFCYPGTGKSGDLAPLKECQLLWRTQLLEQLTSVQLTLVIGKYAIDYHLPDEGLTLTQTVGQWRQYAPNIFVLPHPSPRNNIWLAKNPWFNEQVLPELQKRVKQLLQDE
ncbi:uracil-DNA glycosylase family protein [Shewanella maritima]|uniref:uracil-DNA glycosylase family protein n=1 Tax=Shewanella maritima TaxID=2520507 RepID=UPI0037356DA2